MPQCRKCSNDLKEDSRFCDKCGEKVRIEDEPALPLESTKKVPSKRLYVYSAIGGVLVVGIGVTLFMILNNPIHKFESYVQASKYAEASDVYSHKIKGNLDKEHKAEEFIKQELSTLKQQFKENKVDYQKASLTLETLRKLDLLKSDIESASSEINKLNDSRTAFKKGQEFLSNKNIKDAIKEFKKVISEDDNNAKAQELITSSSSEYKDQVLKDSEQLSSDKDFDKAIALLDEGLSVLASDADFNAKKASYAKLNEEKKAAERKQKMQELEASQEVSAVSNKIFTDWIDDSYISITIKNASQKVIKNYVVGWMGYDKNGYPVKTGWLSPDYLKEGHAEVNVQPGDTFGSDSGWQLTGGYSKSVDAATFKACVKEVEYYDGSKWTNPYYDYWVEEYKQKPLNTSA